MAMVIMMILKIMVRLVMRNTLINSLSVSYTHLTLPTKRIV